MPQVASEATTHATKPALPNPARAAQNSDRAQDSPFESLLDDGTQATGEQPAQSPPASGDKAAPTAAPDLALTTGQGQQTASAIQQQRQFHRCRHHGRRSPWRPALAKPSARTRRAPTPRAASRQLAGDDAKSAGDGKPTDGLIPADPAAVLASDPLQTMLPVAVVAPAPGTIAQPAPAAIPQPAPGAVLQATPDGVAQAVPAAVPQATPDGVAQARARHGSASRARRRCASCSPLRFCKPYPTALRKPRPPQFCKQRAPPDIPRSLPLRRPRVNRPNPPPRKPTPAKPPAIRIRPPKARSRYKMTASRSRPAMPTSRPSPLRTMKSRLTPITRGRGNAARDRHRCPGRRAEGGR